MPVRGDATARKCLELCKRGWPEFEWKVYELEMEPKLKGVKSSRPTLKLGCVTDIALRECLRIELKSRFPIDFDID